ncbi:MAG: UDP-N-acetylglucosamine pyrophosphorylase [Firmicutes bacterium]|nr:UDP-N-acetylglucosamine pyrophosphorylase [Bacillota bacterium]
MNNLVYAKNLFSANHTIAWDIFNGIEYAWEALPRIEPFLKELATRLPGDFEQIAAGVWVGKGTEIDESVRIKGPAIIGYDCAIRHTAYIRENVIIGNGAVVGNSTELKNALLFDKVEVPHFNYVGDSILGYKAHLGAGVILSNLKSAKDQIKIAIEPGGTLNTGLKKFGALIGDLTEVGCNSVLNPGTIIGRESMIYPLTMVRGIVPEKHIVKNDGKLTPKTT